MNIYIIYMIIKRIKDVGLYSLPYLGHPYLIFPRLMELTFFDSAIHFFTRNYHFSEIWALWEDTTRHEKWVTRSQPYHPLHRSHPMERWSFIPLLWQQSMWAQKTGSTWLKWMITVKIALYLNPSWSWHPIRTRQHRKKWLTITNWSNHWARTGHSD